MQLVLSLSAGGTERLVIEIVRALSERIDSIVVCLDEPGAWAGEVEAIGVPVIALGRDPGFHPSLASRIARIITEHRIDVVHCHHYSPYIYGLLASVLKPSVKLVFTEHGKLSDHPPSQKRRLVNPILSRWPAELCAVSADLKQHMVAEGFPAKRLRVLYNGIAPGARPSAADRLAMRRALGIPDNAFVMGSVGRLVAVKQFQLLIGAHALLHGRIDNLHTVIAGDGPDRAAIEEVARVTGSAGAVHLLGHREDARAVMAAFDVYVNTSRYEGVSLTILEAMAGALPVVATRVGGNPEVVINNETGYLVSSTAAAIADAVAQLAHNPERRRVMGDAGRWRVKKHFSIARMVEQYAGVYLRGRHADAAAAPIAAPAAADTMSVKDATRSLV